MKTAPAPLSWEPERPFRYIGGDASLDFMNTVDWTPAGLQNDRLTGYDRLLEWGEGAGTLRPDEAAAFRDAATTRSGEATAAVAEARALRQAVHRIAAARAAPTDARGGQREVADAADDFSRFLGRALANLALHLESDGSLRLAWPWQHHHHDRRTDRPVPLAGILWPVARAAADLLTSPDADRLRVCDGPDCGWVFADRSRNGRRRWCEMETCGMLAKERRRASKRQE